MFFPYRTDAPLYHMPVMTVALIVVNFLVFFVMAASPAPDLEDFDIEVVGEGDDIEFVLVDDAGQQIQSHQVGPAKWALSHGDGLHPIQWVTSNFIHADLGHVFGNMLFLWVFGLVVEGKIGNLAFLGVYMGIGILQCAVEQILTLGMDPGISFGASSIVYGMMAISLVWAPRNEISVLYYVSWFWYGSFEISILIVGILYIGWDLLLAFLQGMVPTTELLHSMGAIIGLGVGCAFLKLHWVDCEGWDLLAVMAGNEGRKKAHAPAPMEIKAKRKRRSKSTGSGSGAGTEERKRSVTMDPTYVEQRLGQHLENGEIDDALNLFKRMMKQDPYWRAPVSLSRVLMKDLHERKMWAASIPVMEHYLADNPQPLPRVRLKLAQLLLEHTPSTSKALAVLDAIPPESLTDKLVGVERSLRKRIDQQQSESYELS